MAAGQMAPMEQRQNRCDASRLRSSFKTSARSIARENLSVITTRGTRKSRQILIEDGPSETGCR